jgi:hypothetical protein
VAESARLVFVGLVVPTTRTLRRERVALQTEHAHSAESQHPWIGRTVRTVAALTPLGLHGDMLINERPLFVGVALVANLISTW